MSKLKFHSTNFRISDIILKSVLLLMVSLSSLRVHAQYVALKSNLVYDALCIPSLGTEVRLDSTHTWFRKVFHGPYIGVFGINGGFNLNRIPFFSLSRHRAEGNFNGAGLSIGWHRILSPHWGIETSLSGGYLHLRYRHYREGRYGYHEYTRSSDYFGPVALSVSLVYIIR